MNKQTTFWGESVPPISTCSASRKNTFSTIFYSDLNMCFLHIFSWHLNILYIIHHLIHFVTYFLHYFCMQNMKNLAWLLDEHFHHQKVVQIKRLLSWNSKIYSSFKTNELCTPEPRFRQLSWHSATYRPGT